MNYVLTFVASDRNKPLSGAHLEAAASIIGAYNIRVANGPVWLAPDKAVSQEITGKPCSSSFSRLREFMDADAIDLFITGADNRRKKLLLADMDSTIVRGETLDDLAEFAGIKEQVSKITARAMEGELDFKQALNERVNLLKGLDKKALSAALDMVEINPGAQKLVQTMRKHSATCVLVSGGFTFFTSSIARQTGFHKHHGNVLEIENGALSGTVKMPILDKFSKVEFLRHYTAELRITMQDCMAIGDGANDIPMLTTAGLGIGYRPKLAVAETIDNLILHGDLSAALYVQGYTDEDISFSNSS